jgi:hypothetical protein
MSRYPLQLRCLFYLVFSSEGVVDSNAMLYCLDNIFFVYACCLSLYLNFNVWVEEATEKALPARQKAALP